MSMLRVSQASEHRRSSCDELLATDGQPDLLEFTSDDDSEMTSATINRTSLHQREETPVPARPSLLRVRRREFRASLVRVIALFCACWFSVGSHYTTYVLGPLKSRISRDLGTALLLLGDLANNVKLMTAGIFIFGLGVKPLAVVQETIIARFFKSHGLGVSMAFGLVAGKSASFISARTSYPLVERFGPHAPFYVATFLTAVSVCVNLIYIASSRWLIDEGGAELEAADINEEARRRAATNITEAQALEKVAAKRRVHLQDMFKLNDVFWAYIAVNIFTGMIWSPFTHLSANIIEVRYKMSEKDAANTASYVLVGSVFLYPICGFVVDRFKRKPIVIMLLLLSSFMTLCAYTWLVLPPGLTKTAKPAIAAFGFGHGFAPLLLVLIVPKIVPAKFISTALGAHKSLEQSGATILQTLAGFIMDKDKRDRPDGSSTQGILNVFWSLNVFQLLSIMGVAWLQYQRRARPARTTRNETTPSNDPTQPLLQAAASPRRYSTSSSRSGVLPFEEGSLSSGEQKRGKVFAVSSAGFIFCAWALFLSAAWIKLGAKKVSIPQLFLKIVKTRMGAYKYIGELYKKKQSDVLRFLLRVRCWEYRQLNVIHRASRPSRPDKARRLGYKAKQGYVVYRIRVRRGNRKKPVPKGATYGKPVRQGVNHLKYQRGLRSTAEERVGRRCGNLRVLNSYWVNQDGVYKYYEVILVDPQHKAIRKDARINWIANPVHKHRESRGLTSIGKQPAYAFPDTRSYSGWGWGNLWARSSSHELATASNGSTFIWLPKDDYSGKTFFDGFSFYTDSDPTHGTVNYVNSSYAFNNSLVYVADNGTVFMKGDDTTWLPEGQNRSSVRISSIAQYNTGLFILDLNRAPWGCGVWPAFLGGGQWPYTGEIDVIEGVHDNEHNQVTWHTGPNCTLAVETNYTGSNVLAANGSPITDCDGTLPGNAGCGIIEWSKASYGPYFEAQGGGIFAMKWDEEGIAVYSFYRSAIPGDILAGSPNPANWGPPVAALAPASCDPITNFVNHSIIFDITFCGDWAGNSYATSGCPGSCTTRLMDPTNFVNASWSINSLKVYSKAAINGGFLRQLQLPSDYLPRTYFYSSSA
ncbi:unnamed protein product [Mycena citricolor]|uniref:Ribosomal protein L15 n=1 Tax=Mycena citricolor TaxID=2018698 RepID=A0AAD2HRA6_9AGAR|nr:unnamed protein product [Mycena citricolor]